MQFLYLIVQLRQKDGNDTATRLIFMGVYPAVGTKGLYDYEHGACYGVPASNAQWDAGCAARQGFAGFVISFISLISLAPHSECVGYLLSIFFHFSCRLRHRKPLVSTSR